MTASSTAIGCMFTTVDGKVVIADTRTLAVTEVIDLRDMHDKDLLLGWCRGLLLDGDRLWVGFSRMRADAVPRERGIPQERLPALPRHARRLLRPDRAPTASPRSTPRPPASTRCSGSTPPTEGRHGGSA